MGNIRGFCCFECKKEVGYAPENARRLYVCPACGGNLEVLYDYKKIGLSVSRKSLENNAERSVWRYLDLLPLEGRKFAPPVQIGWTPLYPSRNLGKSLGLTHLYIKDDGRNPSASFKDRAGFVAVARALEQGETVVSGASTGNAASSLACLASAMNLRTVIFVPQTAPAAKIAQLLVFGAQVITVKGTYDQAFDLCLEACAEYGWYNRNTGFNPYTREGKKTCSYEIIEQLGFKCPDKVFVPVGDGNIISGIWKGFRDFYELGLIDRLPQLVGVQAGGSDSILRAFESGGPLPAVSGETLADSISVSIPRDGRAAVRALQESKGFPIHVSDAEILEAMTTLARAEGVFAEPAAAASIAGLKKAVDQTRVRSDETVVALITGNGLKDVASAMKAVGKPHLIEPNMGALRGIVG
ncbi:threonine synthase [Bdellovibrionota bacterium FG-2]